MIRAHPALKCAIRAYPTFTKLNGDLRFKIGN